MEAAFPRFGSVCEEDLDNLVVVEAFQKKTCRGIPRLSAVKYPSSTVVQLAWLHGLHCKQKLFSVNCVQLFINLYSLMFFILKIWLPKGTFMSANLWLSLKKKRGSSFGFNLKSWMKCKGLHAEANGMWCSCQLSSRGVTYLYHYSILASNAALQVGLDVGFRPKNPTQRDWFSKK